MAEIEASEMQSDVERSDAAIEDDIHHIIVRYPPLTHDRHHIHVQVENGHVTISGYLKSQPTEYIFEKNIRQVAGIKSLNTEALYNDEDLRVAVGKMLPYGVQVNVQYGRVVLTGRLPEDTPVEDVVNAVSQVPGVHRVTTAFSA